MTKLQECLYQYIAEERSADLLKDEAYLLARRHCDETESKLTAGMTEEQNLLFNQYVEEENYVASLQLRHIFHETLLIVHNLLNVSL